MFIYNCIYLILLTAIILSVVLLNSSKAEYEKLIINTPFKKNWANMLYRYSYYVPFKWFIDVKEENPRTKDVKNKLAQANLSGVFNYRSFTTLKVGLLISSILAFMFLSLIMDNGSTVLKFLFNIQKVDVVGNDSSNLTQMKYITGMGLLVICLIPNIVLKKRAEAYKYHHLKDIPIVQLFIILMLRSQKPINEVLFALSKINTRYKEIFEVGYRIFLRNKKEGLEYIKESFGATTFKETVNVLKEMGEYSREDSIRLLENNMQQIIEKNNSLKRRNDLSQLVYSQGTLAVPFIAIITLCFVPIAIYGISIFANSNFAF